MKGKTYMEKHTEDVFWGGEGELFKLSEVLQQDPEGVWDLLTSLWRDNENAPTQLSMMSINCLALNFHVWKAAWPTLATRHGETFMNEFWTQFSSEDEYKARAKIANAPLDPITMAGKLKIQAEFIEHCKLAHVNQSPEESYKELGVWLHERIISKDAPSLRSLASSLNKSNFKSDKSHNLKPRILKSFCNLLQKNKAIPTREELDDDVGLVRQSDSGKDSSKNVATDLRVLGLGVLVEHQK